MEIHQGFERIAKDIRSLLQGLPLSTIYENDSEDDCSDAYTESIAEPTVQEILNLDSQELAEESSSDENESVSYHGYKHMTSSLLLDRRVLTVRRSTHDNSNHMTSLAASFGFDIAYAVSLTWDTSEPSTGCGPRLTLIDNKVVASHGLQKAPHLLLTADAFYQFVAERGTYQYESDGAQHGEAFCLFALPISAPCQLCCGAILAGHVHRVVVVGVRLAGRQLSEDKRDELHQAAWQVVRRKLQYLQPVH